jgi:hypothetical protein
VLPRPRGARQRAHGYVGRLSVCSSVGCARGCISNQTRLALL